MISVGDSNNSLFPRLLPEDFDFLPLDGERARRIVNYMGGYLGSFSKVSKELRIEYEDKIRYSICYTLVKYMLEVVCFYRKQPFPEVESRRGKKKKLRRGNKKENIKKINREESEKKELSWIVTAKYFLRFYKWMSARKRVCAQDIIFFSIGLKIPVIQYLFSRRATFSKKIRWVVRWSGKCEDHTVCKCDMILFFSGCSVPVVFDRSSYDRCHFAYMYLDAYLFIASTYSVSGSKVICKEFDYTMASRFYRNIDSYVISYKANVTYVSRAISDVYFEDKFTFGYLFFNCVVPWNLVVRNLSIWSLFNAVFEYFHIVLAGYGLFYPGLSSFIHSLSLMSPSFFEIIGMLVRVNQVLKNLGYNEGGSINILVRGKSELLIGDSKAICEEDRNNRNKWSLVCSKLRLSKTERHIGDRLVYW